MIKELSEKVSPQQTALIVVDVQNDFCAEGGFMHRESEDLTSVHEMVSRLAAFLEQARAAGLTTIFIQSTYGTDANWYLSPVWLDRATRSLKGGHTQYKVCEPDSWGSAFYEVEPQPGELVIRKHRYSAFIHTELELVLRARQIKTVIMTGVATNVCVESTAREAFMRDFYVVMVEDCCACYSDNEHEAALNNIRRYFGEVRLSKEIVDVWSPDRDDVVRKDSPSN